VPEIPPLDEGPLRDLYFKQKAAEMMHDPVRFLKDLRPVFTGKTEENEEITLYQHIDRPEEIHILRPDGELWAIEPGGEITTWMDPTKNEMRVDINSNVWRGQARGQRWDLLSVDAR
jgi:hypothetical protein